MPQPTAPSPDPDDLHDLSSALVMYAGRLVRAVSRRSSHDVPAATLRLLSQVEELEPVSVTQLAQADRTSQPTMSNAVNHLVDRGWAVKRAHPDDARSSLVELTAEGRTALAQARRRNAEIVVERLRADGRHDRDDLSAAVALLQHLLEQQPHESRDPS